MLRNNYFGEAKTHYKLYKCGKNWAVMGISVFSLGLGMLVTSRPVSADVAATSTSSSAVRAETTSASSSSATKADSTSASSSSAVKTETTSASSSSATKADSTSASSSSAVKAETTSTSSSSATKADSTSASSSSAVKAETTSASSSSATKAGSTSASSSSAVKTETTSASSSSAAKAETTSASSSSAAKAETTSASSSSAVKAETTSAKTRQTVTKISYNTLLQQLRTSKALATDKEALTHVTKDNFLAYFSLNGSATYDQNAGIVTITPDEYNKVGNFSLKSKIDMNTSFTLTGKVNLGSNPNGADGIGFAFHNGNTTDIGNAGGNLGIGGLQNALGFKLDTWSNGYQAPQSDKDGSQIDSTNSNDFGWNGDSMNAPYGTFVDTENEEVATKDGIKVQRWWAKDVDGTSQALSKSDVNGQFHDFTVDYDGDTRTLTIKYTQISGKILTWTTTVSNSNQAMAMIVSASTGGAKNLQQFEIMSFDFKQAATVNVKYVDTKGNQIAQGEVTYPNGANVNGTYTTGQLEIPNYKFVRMDDGTATGAKSLPATGTLTKAGDNGTVIYVYAPAYTQTSKTISETIKYIDQDGKEVAIGYTADPITFVTVTNPVDNTTTTYYSTKAKTATLDDNGVPTEAGWTKADSTDFAEVVNPEVDGYKVISNDAPNSDLTSVAVQTVYTNSSDLDFTVVYAKNAPTITTESKTINETIHYVYKDGTTAHDDYVAKPVEFTREVSTDAVTGEKTYGSWSADQSFAAVTSPAIKGYTPDQAEIGSQTVSGDSSDLDFTVVYAKNAPTITTESKTINETIHYVYKDGTTAHDDYVAKPVEFTREVSTDAVTGEKTYGSWSADQSFAAVTSPAIKGYTPDQAEIGSQTVSGDASDLDFTVVYTKDAPTITTESKTINETIHYVYKDGTTAHDDYVAKPVEFTREVSTDAVTGEKTYGSWSADQSFAAVTSPAIKGYTPDQAEIGSQTVSGDSSDLDFTVVYAKNAPTITTESKTINETIHYVYKDGTTAHDDYVAKPVEFTREVSTDAVTGEKTYGSWSADQSFAAVTSPAIKGYTPDQAEIGSQTVSGDASDLDFTVVYTKDAPTKPVNPSQPTTPAKPVNPSQPTMPAKPVNPSQPTTPTKPVNPSQPTTPIKPINPSQSTTPVKPVQAGQAAATNFVDQRLPQTDETDQQHMTLSGLLLLAMSSLLGLFGMTKRQRKE
ncbi:mucin-binding protein [Lactiplantibacillus pentosus]|uniref:mucin-binding protein n=3 Tax=Lactiplantibacillus pentosus TaxID=1589 RepID=UPI003FCDDB85